MISTTPSFDNATMLPTPCFYPSAQPPKWIASDDDTAVSGRCFPTIDVKYPSVEIAQQQIQQQTQQQQQQQQQEQQQQQQQQQLRYQSEMRWPTEFPYQFSFTTPTSLTGEPYPTDPFPSTSVALSNGYKMDATCYYPNAIIPSNYATATTANYFTATPQFSQWKMPAAAVHAASSMKSSVSRLSGSGASTNSTTTPPYRTGPGTNNVRVRTSEKYRMVYTDFQRLELEKEFRTTQFINSERKSQLSSELQLTERQIKIWFQNRRAKDRRDSKKSRVIS